VVNIDCSHIVEREIEMPRVHAPRPQFYWGFLSLLRRRTSPEAVLISQEYVSYEQEMTFKKGDDCRLLGCSELWILGADSLLRRCSLFRRARAEFPVLVEAYGQLHVEADKQRCLAVEARVEGGGQPNFIADERLLE
jgi:hypothetical protein